MPKQDVLSSSGVEGKRIGAERRELIGSGQQEREDGGR